MVTPSPAKMFYQELESWALEQIRAAQESISLMTEVREQCGDDWEVEELTRSIIFEEVQSIEFMKGEAERARAAREKLEPERV